MRLRHLSTAASQLEGSALMRLLHLSSTAHDPDGAP